MKTDLVGRSEEQLVADIERGERIYEISKAWSGNEGLTLALAAKRRNIEVDRRMLAELRGESQPTPFLAGAALAKWRANIVRMGKAGAK